MGYLPLSLREIWMPISRGVLRVADLDYEVKEPKSLAIGEVVSDSRSLHIGVRPDTMGLLHVKFRDRVVPALFVHEIVTVSTKLWVGSADLTTGSKLLVEKGRYQVSWWRNESDTTGGLVLLGISRLGKADE